MRDLLKICLKCLKELIKSISPLLYLCNKLSLKKTGWLLDYRLKPQWVHQYIKFLNNHHSSLKIHFLDIGSRDGVEDSGIFSSLQWLNNKITYGVEPDPEEAEHLIQKHAYDKIYTNAIAGYTGEGTLYIPEPTPAFASLGIELENLKSLHLSCASFCEPMKCVPVKVKKMSEAIGSQTFDFIKLDIHGAEYGALASLDDSFFEKALCFHIETCAIHFFKSEHLMGDLLNFMHSKGFIPLYTEPLPFDGMDMWYNVTFIQNPAKMTTLDQCLKHCLIGFMANKPHYVAYILRIYQEKFGVTTELDPIFKLLRSPSIPPFFYEKKFGTPKHA